MALTDAQMLDLIDTAIQGVLTNGQAIGSDGRSWTKADLATLYRMREDLQKKVSAASAHPLRRAWVGTVGRD